MGGRRDKAGLMRRCIASINDSPISGSNRRFYWPLPPSGPSAVAQ